MATQEAQNTIILASITGLLPNVSAKLDEIVGAMPWKIKYATTDIFMIDELVWKYDVNVGNAGK